MATRPPRAPPVNATPWMPIVSNSGVTTSAPRKSPIHQFCTESQKAWLAMPVSPRTLTAMIAHASVDTSAAAAKTSTCRNFAKEIGPSTPILTSQAPSTAAANFTKNNAPATE